MVNGELSCSCSMKYDLEMRNCEAQVSIRIYLWPNTNIPTVERIDGFEPFDFPHFSSPHSRTTDYSCKTVVHKIS